MKNLEKVTELQEYIEASGIEQAIETLRNLCGEYFLLEKRQDKKKDIGLGFIKIIEANWKLEEALEYNIKESEKWEEIPEIDEFNKG